MWSQLGVRTGSHCDLPGLLLNSTERVSSKIRGKSPGQVCWQISDMSADRWPVLHTAAMCSSATELRPPQLCFPNEGEENTLYLVCPCCHYPQTRQNLVSNLHAGWSSGSRAATSWLRVCFSKTHPSKPCRCFWLAPSGIMSCWPGFIPVFRAFCVPEWKIKLLPLLIPLVASGKQRICFTVVTLKVNWKSWSPARSERLWIVQLCP